MISPPSSAAGTSWGGTTNLTLDKNPSNFLGLMSGVYGFLVYKSHSPSYTASYAFLDIPNFLECSFIILIISSPYIDVSDSICLNLA